MPNLRRELNLGSSFEQIVIWISGHTRFCEGQGVEFRLLEIHGAYSIGLWCCCYIFGIARRPNEVEKWELDWLSGQLSVSSFKGRNHELNSVWSCPEKNMEERDHSTVQHPQSYWIVRHHPYTAASRAGQVRRARGHLAQNCRCDDEQWPPIPRLCDLKLSKGSNNEAAA